MAFNTGNPVPSTDAKDLSDNAENFDGAINAQADTWIDRLGVPRDTVTGRIKKMGFTVPVAYAVSIVFGINDNVKTVEEVGVVYAPLPSALPFTTSGTFIGDDDARFFVVQGVTASQLTSYTDIVFPTAASMQAGIPEIPYALDDALKVQGEDGVSKNYTVVAGGAAPDLLLAGGLWARPLGFSAPKVNAAGIADPIISAPIQSGTTQKWWANYFSQNFVIGDGGANLNDTASGTKDGNNNVLIGFGVMPVATTSYANAVMGFNAANAVTTANSLSAFGYQAGINLTTGDNNSLFGTDAGFNLTTGNNNSLFGRHIFFDGVAVATGDNNSCLGYDIALVATTLNNMVIIGAQAHRDGATSARSVIIGSSAAQQAAASDSVIIGRQTLQNVTAGLVTTVEIGARVNENALSVDRNAIVGYNSFFTLTQGLTPTSFNAALGSQSGLNIYGTNNTLLGNRAGAQAALTARTGQVLIGARAGDGWAQDNDFVIANTQTTLPLMKGNFVTKALTIEATALDFRNLPTSAGASGTLWKNGVVVQVSP